MPAFLDADTADAICTLIFIGYISDPATASKVNIQYMPDENKYQAVTDLMKGKLGITTNFTPSIPQDKFAFIAALAPKTSTLDSAMQQLSDNGTLNYLKSIADTANNTPNVKAPYGAYIGGGMGVDKMTIIGPSQLDVMQLQYRTNDNDGQAYYDAFLQNTNVAIDAMNNTPINKLLVKLPVNLTNNTKKTPGTKIPVGSTVKSYHGMIQAMATIPSFANNLIFEIALGDQTKKVSSCLPCSLFMAASNSPASSTHLGKGDYWNIPASVTSGVRQAWSQKIFDCYTLGKKLATGKSIAKIDAAIAKLPSALENNKDLANVFLEALTFPNSFTTKIANTFAATRTDPKPPGA